MKNLHQTVTAQIKYLAFKGIPKKEQILFRSFLNLAKNELAYQVVILKEDHQNSDDPDIMIIDESYEFEPSEASLKGLPSIKIGDDIDILDANYIARPVQWSDFKSALSQLDIEAPVEEDVERVLPVEIQFEIDATVGATVSELDDSQEDSEDVDEEIDYDYELDNLSADYHSITNSDYIKVVDDVKQFGDVGKDVGEEPVVLITDDESASTNSVLVLETNSMDAWDFSETEMEFASTEMVDSETQWHDGTKKKRKVGIEVAPDEEYWLEDNEIIVDHETLLYIMPKRKLVYSEVPPGKWPPILQRKGLSKLPLIKDWRPEKGMQGYPVEDLVWINTLISETTSLLSDLDDNTEYMLEKWPHFELLELDNILLKLCTMLFVRPVSLKSLATKSGYGRSTIVGLMNACHEIGLLKTEDEIDMGGLSKANTDEGMFGKIKDVFR